MTFKAVWDRQAMIRLIAFRIYEMKKGHWLINELKVFRYAGPLLRHTTMPQSVVWGSEFPACSLRREAIKEFGENIHIEWILGESIASVTCQYCKSEVYKP